MNIIYLHRTKGKGVEGVHVHGIINAFKRLGHKVEMICPVKNADNHKGSESSILRFSVSRCPELLFEVFEILYNFISFRQIRYCVRRNKYDFIYERFAFNSWSGFYACGKYNIPYILEVNYTTYTHLVRKRSKILMPLTRFFEKKCLNNADAIFVVSTFLKKQLVGMGVSEDKIYLTPNAVDENIYGKKYDDSSIKNNLNLNGKKIIGFVGGFYPWHGLPLLLHAVKIVEEKVNNLCLLLVGDGPMKEELKKIARDLSLNSKLLFVGTIEPSLLPLYISCMDICVMPDSNDYGSPMKIFEYMAMGKAVVAPRLGPLEDIISDEVNGLLFEKGNVAALANCFKRIFSDEILKISISENARETVFKNHLWSNNVKKVIEAYDKVRKNRK